MLASGICPKMSATISLTAWLRVIPPTSSTWGSMRVSTCLHTSTSLINAICLDPRVLDALHAWLARFVQKCRNQLIKRRALQQRAQRLALVQEWNFNLHAVLQQLSTQAQLHVPTCATLLSSAILAFSAASLRRVLAARLLAGICSWWVFSNTVLRCVATAASTSSPPRKVLPFVANT